MDMIIIITRFLLTFIAAFIFGYERQKSHKPVGFGTFIFVSSGACVLSLIADYIGLPDSLPLISAIITGIGFLGAGALIKGTDKVFGFTTAASIWLFAIFGVIVGLGYYFIGSMVYASIWIVMLYDNYLERKGIGSYQRRLTLVTNQIIKEEKIKEVFIPYMIKHTKLNLEVDKHKNKMNVTYIIEGTRESLNKVASELLEHDWIDLCKIE